MPNISVVVPVYKVEPYLDRCVQSILGQTYESFDLYLVDDGSPDNCGAICDRWAKRDSRIHVIHQKNGGLSVARNAGIEQSFAESDSQWITFIDSDDWIHPNTLEWLLRAAQECGTSISVCGYGNTAGEDPWNGELKFRAEKWQAADFYSGKFVNATIACAKLYQKNYFKTLTYPVGKIHEDEFTTYRLLFEAGEIAYLDLPLYAYFVNLSGISKTTWSPRRLDAWEAYEEQIAFFTRLGNEKLVRFRYRGYLENAMVNLCNAEQANQDGKYTDVIRFMEKRMRSVIRRAWKAGEISFWPDFDTLYRFYPYLSRVYRLYLELTHR